MQAARFTMQMVLSGPDTRVIIGGELDITTAADLAKGLVQLREDARGGGLVLDLSGVEFIDCACACIIDETTRTWPGPGRAVIAGPSPIVRRVFELTGLAAGTGLDQPADGLRPSVAGLCEASEPGLLTADD